MHPRSKVAERPRSDLNADLDEGDAPPRTGVIAWIRDVLSSWGPPILLVLVIRSILGEPFQIPSGSMVPTLAIGDFILVSKFTYGLRVPFTNIEILPLGEPERGDIVVFIHPPTVSRDPLCPLKRIPRGMTFDIFPGVPGPGPCTTDFIKRVVGLPGDTIEVRDHIVFVNGAEMKQTPMGDLEYEDPRHSSYRDSGSRCETVRNRAATEDLTGVDHAVLQSAEYGRQMTDFRPTTVPEGHYFMMGDNRDNSEDSRFWGFVPRDHIRGKAKYVWLSFDPCVPGARGLGSPRWERIGTALK